LRKKFLAFAAVSLIAVTAFAGIAVGSPKYFFGKASPGTHVKPGTVVTATAHGVLKSTAYFCAMSVYEYPGNQPSYGDKSIITRTKSNSAGVVSCKLKFEPFSGKNSKGKVLSCPVSPALAKQHFTCGIGIVDAATIGGLSAGEAPFTAVK
jgi:hypothetical protein